MAIKYTIPFKSINDKDWRVDISDTTPDTGEDNPVVLIGTGSEAFILNYTSEEVDDPYEPIINSDFQLSVYNQGNIDINKLQSAADRSYTVKVYKENILKWSGFLLTDGIQYSLLTAPTEVVLSATDGLSLLNKMPYVHADLNGANGQMSRCPINYIRQILFGNLGIFLPIRWTNNLRCTAFAGDVMSTNVEWSTDNQGFYSYQSGPNGELPGPLKSCEYILKGILESFQCRIYQAEGKWVIRRVNDTVTGQLLYKQTPGNLDTLNIQTGSENILYTIGTSGYPIANERALITSKPGIKTCQVTYEANVRENIVPNGNQDTIDPENSLPAFWNTYETPFSITSIPGLDGRVPGSATYLLNFSTGPVLNYTLITPGSTLGNDGLPIDTNTLVKAINFGFTFSPLNNFPINPSTGFIDWTSEPFPIQVIFNVGSIKYYLNQFGFWQTDAVEIPISVPGLSLNDIARIDFDVFRNVIMPTPVAQPEAGDISDIQIIFKIKNDIGVALDNIYINVEKANDVFESTNPNTKNTLVEEKKLNISSSFGGYMVSNYMTSWSKSDTECFFADGLLYEGTLTGLTANAIMRYRYKASKIFNGDLNVRAGNWSFDSVYFIEGITLSKFLPLAASYNLATSTVKGLIAMECRNENPILVEKYYSSNDEQLSN